MSKLNESKYFWENKYNSFDINLISQIKSVFENNLEGAKIFLSLLKNGSHILDFGCGFGRNTVYLLQKGFKVDISDISEISMDICKENALKSGYKVEKVQYKENLNCEDNSFDGVILWSVLDHMTLENAKDIINEISRVCKDGSILLCSFDGQEEIDINAYKRNDDGSIKLIEGKNKGMILRFFSNEEILNLFKSEWEVLYFCGITSDSEKIIVCRKKWF